MKKRMLAISMVLAMLVMSGCGDNMEQMPPVVDNYEEIVAERKPAEELQLTEEQQQPQIDQPAEEIPLEEETVAGGYANVVSKLGNGQNFIYAPESLKIALSMYSAMVEDPAEKDNLTEFFGGRDYLSYKSSSTYKFVNRIWTDTNKEYNFDNLSDQLKGYVYAIDMSAEDATQTKNAYVAEQTDNFLTETPTTFDALTIMDVMNIAYFHGVWDKSLNDIHPFDDEVMFRGADGKARSTEMIGFEREHSYLESNTAYGVELFYTAEKDETANRMFIILPKDGYEIKDVDVDAFLPNGNATTEYVDIFTLKMPRIDTKCDWEMKAGDNINEVLGLKDFGTAGISGDICALADGQMPTLTQTLRIVSDEEGTTAVAVTEVMIKNDIASLEEPTRFDFICDHPFLYVIYDGENNDVAFVGQYVTAE